MQFNNTSYSDYIIKKMFFDKKGNIYEICYNQEMNGEISNVTDFNGYFCFWNLSCVVKFGDLLQICLYFFVSTTISFAAGFPIPEI